MAPGVFYKWWKICATQLKPLRHNGFSFDGLITPTLKAAGSNPVGRTRKTASIAGCLPFFLLPRRADLIRVCSISALYKGGGPSRFMRKIVCRLRHKPQIRDRAAFLVFGWYGGRGDRQRQSGLQQSERLAVSVPADSCEKSVYLHADRVAL